MYNATVKSTRNGQPWGTFVAEVVELSGRLQMLRSNSATCTGYEGKVTTLLPGELADKYPGEVALYDVYIRESSPNETFEIILDGCAGYRNLLGGMDLPPAYKEA